MGEQGAVWKCTVKLGKYCESTAGKGIAGTLTAVSDAYGSVTTAVDAGETRLPRCGTGSLPDTPPIVQKRWQIVGDVGKRWATREDLLLKPATGPSPACTAK